MSSRDAERCPDVPGLSARLEAYYSRYYGDALGIPGWRELVAVRLDDAAYERERLARLEGAIGRRVAGARLLNVGCGTGGLNYPARRRRPPPWGAGRSRAPPATAAPRSPRLAPSLS